MIYVVFFAREGYIFSCTIKEKEERILGRGSKVLQIEKMDRRELGYYYTPDFVARYLTDRLRMIQPNGRTVLDPCVGKEELVTHFLAEGYTVDGVDIFRHEETYGCTFTQMNFIDVYREQREPLHYDYYIANPPYNCHEVDYIQKNKKELKTLFSDVGVHNMYSMFISALIDVAKDGAVLGLITYDSFFTAKAHQNLRRKILETCTIHEITMCPTDLFHEQSADVRTSIIILQKGTAYQKGIYAKNRPISTAAFTEQLQQQLTEFMNGEVDTHTLDELILNDEKDYAEWMIDCPMEVKKLFQYDRLGDKFDCVTGISTGKDALYLSKEKRAPFTIPFYKNPGSHRFYAPVRLYLHEDFLEFDRMIKTFNVRNKQLLYQSGITCSSMGVAFTASRLPKNVTYGVNANIICEDEDVWWLLAYLNSDLATYLVRGILNRSNMVTSGYVARVPLLPFTNEQKSQLGILAKQAYELAEQQYAYEDQLKDINDMIHRVTAFSNETTKKIKEFNRNLVQRT